MFPLKTGKNTPIKNASDKIHTKVLGNGLIKNLNSFCRANEIKIEDMST